MGRKEAPCALVSFTSRSDFRSRSPLPYTARCPKAQAQANLLLERVVAVTDADIPFFTSDQLAEYLAALLHAYGQWVGAPA